VGVAWQLLIVRLSEAAPSADLGGWRTDPNKKCVTTHLPNESAPKMDGAQVHHLYSAFSTWVMC